MLYIAIGIIGATVMPHNLYLHSALVQTRRFQSDERSIRSAIRFNSLDAAVALSIAFLVNAGILVLACDETTLRLLAVFVLLALVLLTDRLLLAVAFVLIAGLFGFVFHTSDSSLHRPLALDCRTWMETRCSSGFSRIATNGRLAGRFRDELIET